MSGRGSNPAEELPGKWSEVKALFAEALDIDPTIRSSWLEERCRNNPALAGELASLLEHDLSDDRFLETPAWRPNGQSGAEGDSVGELGVSPGTSIGSWKVLHEIRTGGMGTVYLAERTIDDDDQPVRQRAAIKIIRARVDAKLFAGRFRLERRILAQLNHPFIARFLEGGTLRNGLPYFALDYVEGEPIDEYCRLQQLGLTEILRLFCQVCSAVAYAHRNLVVHRDLKPSNILITADGTPRLLDFGIAKLLVDEEESVDQTAGFGPCTPRYSSPEQIRSGPVTIASDIFALGIILHELVTGFHPFDSAKEGEPAAAIDVLRRISEDQPGNLRVQNGKGPTRRGDRHALCLSKDDLESIILRALQKRPVDRYKSVEYLIDDIQSLIDHRPVLARKQSWWYRTRTLIRRHPTATFSTSIAAIIGVLALGFIFASDRAMRKERDYALQQRELAASSARTMINDLASSLESMSAPIERRLELLQRVASVFDQIDTTTRVELEPAKSAIQIRAEVQTQVILTRALEELGDIQGAIRRADTAELEVQKLVGNRTAEPGDVLILAEIRLEKCRALSEAGKGAIAHEVLEETLTKLREIEGVSNLEQDVRRKLQVLLSHALVQRVRLSEAMANPGQTLELVKEAIQHGERAYQSQPADREAVFAYTKGLEQLGAFYYNLGRFDLFGDPVRKALALLRKAAGEAPADIGLQQRSERAVARWSTLLAIVDSQDGKLVIPGESLELLRKLSAMDPRNVDLLEDLVRELENCGSVLTTHREYETARKLLKEAIEIGKRLIDEKKSGFQLEDDLQLCAFGLSICYSKTGDLEAARKVNLELLAPLTERLETLDLDKSNNRFREALCCLAQAEVAGGNGKWEEAQEIISRGLRLLEENLYGRDYIFDKAIYADSLVKLGSVLGERGNAESGCRYIDRGLQILYALRDNGRKVPRIEILSDISDAEETLRRYKPNTKDTDRLATPAQIR